MTFTQATSSDRDFRRVEDNKSEFFWEGDGEDKELMERYLGSVRAPLFTWRDYFKGEFEFVEDEVIEVGDVVKWGADDYESIVEALSPVTACIRWDGTLYIRMISDLTLISKGPRVHTFEGEINDIHFKDGDPYNGGAQHFQSGPFKRLTLTEEEK